MQYKPNVKPNLFNTIPWARPEISKIVFLIVQFQPKRKVNMKLKLSHLSKTFEWECYWFYLREERIPGILFCEWIKSCFSGEFDIGD